MIFVLNTLTGKIGNCVKRVILSCVVTMLICVLAQCSQSGEDSENNRSLVRDQFNLVNVATRTVIYENADIMSNERFEETLIMAANAALSSNLRPKPIGGSIFLNTNDFNWRGLKSVSGQKESMDFVFMLKRRLDGAYWSQHLLNGEQLVIIELEEIPPGFIEIEKN